MDGIHIFLNAARGASVMRGLHAAGHGIAAVYVPPQRAAHPEITAACAACGIAPTGVANVNDPSFVATLGSATLSVIAGFSTIFGEPLIAAPRLGTINLHAGRLPQYRGGSPLNWQIINGERTAWVSVIRVDAGIDTGDVLAEGAVEIGPDDTIADLHERANMLFPKLTVQVVDRFARGDLGGRQQDEAAALYWHQRNDADGRIDWRTQTAQRVHNLVRAVTRPYPGAFTEFDGRRLRIYATELPAIAITGIPGRIVHLQGRGPYVVCADRAVLLRDFAFEDGGAAHLPTGTHLAGGHP